ncbi:hypothetical protein JCM19233_5645 [Vibrio astriarenae]|nr:hypothetical protein JCM19233_5645 [Vibrio sp. C7]
MGVEDLLNGIASCEGMLNAAATFVPQVRMMPVTRPRD